MERAKVSKTFRITPEQDSMLKQLSKLLNLSENQVISLAIQHFYEEKVNRSTGKLLEEKDRLIAKLTQEKDKLIKDLTKYLLKEKNKRKKKSST